MASLRRIPRRMRADVRSARSRARRAHTRHQRDRDMRAGCPMCRMELTVEQLGPDLVLALCRRHYRQWLAFSEGRSQG